MLVALTVMTTGPVTPAGMNTLSTLFRMSAVPPVEERAGEDIALVSIAAGGDFEIEVVDERIAGGRARHVRPGERDAQRLRIIAYGAGDDALAGRSR